VTLELRTSDPLKFRLVLQPTMAVFLATRSGFEECTGMESRLIFARYLPTRWNAGRFITSLYLSDVTVAASMLSPYSLREWKFSDAVRSLRGGALAE